MMTREEYIASLRNMKLNVYFMGEKIDNPVDHPVIRPSMNSVALTYELAQQEEYKELMTATSNLTGKNINRFTHLHQRCRRTSRLCTRGNALAGRQVYNGYAFDGCQRYGVAYCAVFGSRCSCYYLTQRCRLRGNRIRHRSLESQDTERESQESYIYCTSRFQGRAYRRV